jgi:hypothetical protein
MTPTIIRHNNFRDRISDLLIAGYLKILIDTQGPTLKKRLIQIECPDEQGLRNQPSAFCAAGSGKKTNWMAEGVCRT